MKIASVTSSLFIAFSTSFRHFLKIVKVAATDMRYFAKSQFSRGLVHKKSSYILKRGTTWNHLKPLETSWNQLKAPETIQKMPGTTWNYTIIIFFT